MEQLDETSIEIDDIDELSVIRQSKYDKEPFTNTISWIEKIEIYCEK